MTKFRKHSRLPLSFSFIYIYVVGITHTNTASIHSHHRLRLLTHSRSRRVFVQRDRAHTQSTCVYTHSRSTNSSEHELLKRCSAVISERMRLSFKSVEISDARRVFARARRLSLSLSRSMYRNGPATVRIIMVAYADAPLLVLSSSRSLFNGQWACNLPRDSDSNSSPGESGFISIAHKLAWGISPTAVSWCLNTTIYMVLEYDVVLYMYWRYVTGLEKYIRLVTAAYMALYPRRMIINIYKMHVLRASE